MSLLGELTLGEIRTQSLGYVALGSTPQLRTKVNNLINIHYERIAKRQVWPTLVKSDEVGLRKFDTTDETLGAADAYVPLPFGCRDVTGLVLQNPQSVEVRRGSPVEVSRLYETTRTGTPRIYAVVGQTAQYKKLTADSTLKLKGDAANNDAATARIYFVQADGMLGEVVSESLTGTFSTGVATTGTAELGWNVERVVVSSDWVGDVIITDSADAEIGRFSGAMLPIAGNPQGRNLSRALIRVAPIPDTDIKATLSWRVVPQRLINDNDAPMIPVSTALTYFVAADLLRIDRKFSEAAMMDRQAREALGDIQQVDESPQDQVTPMFGSFLSQTGYNDGGFGGRGWR